MRNKYFTVEVSSYIDKLMNNLWNETLKGNTKAVFFNTKNSEAFSQYMDSYLQSISLKTKTFRRKIEKAKFYEPYYPFLDFVKGTLLLKDRQEIKDFIKNADVYYFQQPVFLSYFHEESTKRKEEVILEELAYEKDRMHESILNLYSSLAENYPMIIVIEDLHNAKQSTLELIEYLISRKEKNNIFYIFSFDKEYQFEIQEKQNQWDEFVNCVHTYDTIIDIEIPKDIKKDYFSEHKEEKSLKAEEIIDLSMMSFHFFALRDAKEYITTVYSERIVDNTTLTSAYYLKMFHLLGDVHYFLGESDNALMYYNSLLNFAQRSRNIEEISYCYERMGEIYWRKGNVKRAERLGKYSLQYATESNNEMLVLYSNLLLFLIGHRGSEIDIEQFQTLYYDSIEIAKKYNMKNILAYYYTQPSAIALQSDEERITFSDLGIAIATKYNNKYRLAAAYHAKGVFYKSKGIHDKGLKYYKKSEKLKLELGYDLEIAFINNGLGFYCFIKENYEEASSYYHKALVYLKNLKNYNEIGNTLFNIALNYYMTLQSKLAIQCLEKLLLLMNILKMDSITYHTMFGIYSLMGINYCQLGDISKAYECMIKIKEIGSVCYLDDDKFLVKLFKGLLYKLEGDYKKATFYFEVTKPYLQKHTYIAPRFYYEYGLVKKEQSKEEEATSLFTTAMEYCDKLQYFSYRQLLLKELGVQTRSINPFTVNRKFFDLQWIIDCAKQELIINDLHKKINEINFLNILQEIIGREKKKEKLIESVMNLMNDTFFLEHSFMHLKEENQWKCIYGNSSLEKTNFDILKIVENFAQKQKITLISNLNEDLKYKDISNNFFSIIDIPLIDNNELIGNILCTTKKEEINLKSDDFKILSMAAKQLIDGLKKIKKEEEILQKDKEIYEANESERLKTEFLCNLSHEFRTPLNIILGTLQLLSLKVRGCKESRYFEVMKQNCYRLLRLINNLIDVSKIDSGFYKTNLENHNIASLVEEITLSVVPYVEQKGICLQFDTNVEEKIMGCDVDQMERVILNLLSNSIKFTKPGGKITVNFYDKGESILIIIKDTGIGIPKNKINMIFERFGQVDKSLTRNHEGSGIGLSLVKSIVEMWGGNISLESEWGKGSSFTIEVPVTILPEDNLQSKDDKSIASGLSERTQVEFSDIYF